MEITPNVRNIDRNSRLECPVVVILRKVRSKNGRFGIYTLLSLGRIVRKRAAQLLQNRQVHCVLRTERDNGRWCTREIDRETDSQGRSCPRAGKRIIPHIDKVTTSGKNRDATTRSSILSSMAGRSLPPGRHTTFNLFATTRLRGRYGGNDISDVMSVNPYPYTTFESFSRYRSSSCTHYVQLLNVYLFDYYSIIIILNIWYYRMRGELRVSFSCNNRSRKYKLFYIYINKNNVWVKSIWYSISICYHMHDNAYIIKGYHHT